MLERQNGDGLPDCSREPVSNATTTNPNLARKTARRKRAALHTPHPEPKNSGQKWHRLRGWLRDDDAFCGLPPSYRYVIEYAYEKWGHGPQHGNDGFCWFARKQVAGELRVSEKTIERAFEGAASAGVLTISSWLWADSKKQAANSYQLHERFLEPVDTLSEADRQSDHLSTTNIPSPNLIHHMEVPSFQSGTSVASQIEPGPEVFEFGNSANTPLNAKALNELDPKPNIPPVVKVSTGSAGWQPSADDLAWHQNDERLRSLTQAERDEEVRKSAHERELAALVEDDEDGVYNDEDGDSWQ